jgi:hypothetical protein
MWSKLSSRLRPPTAARATSTPDRENNDVLKNQKAFTSKAKNQNKKRVWPLRSQKRRFLSKSFYFKS